MVKTYIEKTWIGTKGKTWDHMTLRKASSAAKIMPGSHSELSMKSLRDTNIVE